MNKSVLALSTALSIFAFAPAFAQTTPTVDCTVAANAKDPACVNQTNMNNSQSGAATDQNSGQTATGTNSSSTDQNAQSGTGTGSSGTMSTDQNAQSGTGTGSSGTMSTDQNAQSGTSSSGTMSTDQNAQSGTGSSGTMSTDQNNAQTGTGTTSTMNNSTAMNSGDLFVPADRLNGAQLMSANDYIGKTVYDQTGANIGEVNDIILSNDGQIQAVILGVGGFLGIGEKDVAVSVNAVQMVQDGNTNRLMVQATKDALNSAPTYDRTNRRYATDMNANAPADNTGSTTTAPATGTNAGGADGDPNTAQ